MKFCASAANKRHCSWQQCLLCIYYPYHRHTLTARSCCVERVKTVPLPVQVLLALLFLHFISCLCSTLQQRQAQDDSCQGNQLLPVRPGFRQCSLDILLCADIFVPTIWHGADSSHLFMHYAWYNMQVPSFTCTSVSFFSHLVHYLYLRFAASTVLHCMLGSVNLPAWNACHCIWTQHMQMNMRSTCGLDIMLFRSVCFGNAAPFCDHVMLQNAGM